MADNATITNRKTTFDSDANPDIATRAVEKNALKSQVVILDWGGSGAEDLVIPDFSTEATLSALNAKVAVVDTGDVTIGTSLPSGGNTIGNVGVVKSALTPASPTNASVGTSSASVLASNANRKGLVLTNLSSNNISFGLGAPAVLSSGITLTPYGAWVMDEYTFCTSQIFAIASGAASNLAIQEYT